MLYQDAPSSLIGAKPGYRDVGAVRHPLRRRDAGRLSNHMRQVQGHHQGLMPPARLKQRWLTGLLPEPNTFKPSGQRPSPSITPDDTVEGGKEQP